MPRGRVASGRGTGLCYDENDVVSCCVSPWLRSLIQGQIPTLDKLLEALRPDQRSVWAADCQNCAPFPPHSLFADPSSPDFKQAFTLPDFT